MWRPLLRDLNDEHVFATAIASGSKYIVTFNKKDFDASVRFGLRVVTPKEYLEMAGEIP
jgi:predicted nucleic acid-binding protein